MRTFIQDDKNGGFLRVKFPFNCYKFPLGEAQFGKSVHMLDLLVYLNEDNSIHYHGYIKPIDSKTEL